MLRPFELFYLALSPGLCSLHQIVRRRLNAVVSAFEDAEILDVGGRKSPYTIGVGGRVTITDLPRESEVQEVLNLGITDAIAEQVRTRRSNISAVLYDDMTRTMLPPTSFDVVLAIEVLEHLHLEEGRMFVENVHRVLRPGGTFLMTTPNGDTVRLKNKPCQDHKHHYRGAELGSLLTDVFGAADIAYTIPGGALYHASLDPLTPRHPLRSIQSFVSNGINTRRALRPEVAIQAHGTRHLIAVARKQGA